MQRLGSDEVVAGDLGAREIWSRMSKSQIVDDDMEHSKNYMRGSVSGLCHKIKSTLQNKKLVARFTEAERAVLR